MFGGSAQMMLHANAIAAPLRIVAGSSTLWSASCVSSLAMWGTAKPMNATGPQKAVVTAVRIPVERSMSILMLRMLKPRLMA